MQNNEIDILDNINLLSLNNLEESDSGFYIQEVNNNINLEVEQYSNELNLEIEETKVSEPKSEKTIEEHKVIIDTIPEEIKQEDIKEEIVYNTKKERSNFISAIIFFTKYISTSAAIFVVLLLTTNYSAYIALAKSYIFSQELKQTQSSIIKSVNAAKITDEIKKDDIQNADINNIYSIKSMSSKVAKTDYKLDIDITPYENRIIIPKIGKNIPLLDVKNKTVSGEKELENILMTELQSGVVRYPGSAKPGQNGNTFIFGHSSNLPWIKGDYNDVFTLLDKLETGDEIIIFYNQKKYIYKIDNKQVVSPGKVGVIKNKTDNKQLSLMTCWPVGTTLNRLVVSGKMIEN